MATNDKIEIIIDIVQPDDESKIINKIISSFDLPKDFPKMHLSNIDIKFKRISIQGMSECFSIVAKDDGYIMIVHHKIKPSSKYKLIGIFELAECIRKNYYQITTPLHIV